MMGQNCALSKSADDTKLRGVSDMPYCCTAVQKNFNKLRKGAGRNFVVIQQGVQCPTVGKEKLKVQEQGRQQDGKQLCRKGSEGPRGCHFNVKQYQRPVVSWAAFGGVLPSEHGRWFFPSTQQW